MHKKSIDWLKASDKNVAALYQIAKNVRDRRDISWKEFYDLCLLQKFTPGLGYEDNFRAGKISRSKAHQIASWIDENYPDLAEQLRAKCEEKGALWEKFVGDHGQFGHVRTIPFRRAGMGIVEFVNAGPVSEIKLGAPFYFMLTIPEKGTLSSFQKYGDAWYCLPLQRDGLIVPTEIGQVAVPILEKSSDIDPVSENRDFGKHEFVFVHFSGDSKHEAPQKMRSGEKVDGDDLDMFAAILMRRLTDVKLFRNTLMVQI